MRHTTALLTTAILLNSNAWVHNADFNRDGKVDLGDFFAFADEYGQEVSESNDKFELNGDGLIVLDDFFLFADQFGRDVRAAMKQRG